MVVEEEKQFSEEVELVFVEVGQVFVEVELVFVEVGQVFVEVELVFEKLELEVFEKMKLVFGKSFLRVELILEISYHCYHQNFSSVLKI